MKFKRPIHCKIYTPIMLRNPQDFFMRVHHYCDHFSDMLPEKCGFWSPLKISFTPEMIESLIPEDRGGAADRLYCQRLKKPRCHVQFSPSSIHGKSHSEEYICAELGQVDQNKLIEYIKETTVKYMADLAIIDANRGKEPDPLIIEGWRDITPITLQLKHWLPDMYWGVVFGKPYVDLFGLNILMSVPAYRVEKLSDHAVYIQLSEFVDDVFEKRDYIDEQREILKQHLGNDAFWSNEKSYVINIDYRVLKGLSEHTVIHIPLQTNYTDVFRVPHFKFISDTYMQAEIAPVNMEEYLSEIKQIGTDDWEVRVSQKWLLRPFDTSVDYDSYGDVEEISFFYKPDGYDLPVDKELFIGAWDHSVQDIQEYAKNILVNLKSAYPQSETKWECIEQSVQEVDGVYVVLLDQIDQQQHNIFRIVSKVLIFPNYVVKLTFMDYWVDRLDVSKEISDPIMDSFKKIGG